MTRHPIPSESPSDATVPPDGARPSRRSSWWAPPAAIVVGALLGAVGALVLIGVTADRADYQRPDLVGSKQPPPPARVESAPSSSPRPDALVVPDEIDRPTGECGPSTALSCSSVIDAVTSARPPAYLIVQGEIARALAERGATRCRGSVRCR